MTFVFAMRCVDGVVLVADRRLTKWDGSLEYREKLHVFPGVVFGFSGSETAHHELCFEMTQRVSRLGAMGEQRPVEHLYPIVRQALQEMKERNPEQQGWEVEIAFAIQTSLGAMLFKIPPEGGLRPVRGYAILGGADPFVQLFINKALEDGPIEMEKAARLGYFCAKYLHHFELAEGVGFAKRGPQGFPQVILLPDDDETVFEVRKSLPKFEAWSKDQLKRLQVFLDGLL